MPGEGSPANIEFDDLFIVFRPSRWNFFLVGVAGGIMLLLDPSSGLEDITILAEWLAIILL